MYIYNPNNVDIHHLDDFLMSTYLTAKNIDFRQIIDELKIMLDNGDIEPRDFRVMRPLPTTDDGYNEIVPSYLTKEEIESILRLEPWKAAYNEAVVTALK